MSGKSQKWPDKHIIGLTGNIAAGKSAVSALLAEHPLVQALDADQTAHRVLLPAGECYDAVLARFGRGILADAGAERPPIDRRRLGSIVFQDAGHLRELEALLHPAIRRILVEQIQSAAEPIIVLEAIKLLESSLREDLDEVWVVDAAESVRAERLQATRGMSTAEARQRIVMQAPQAEKLAQADRIIHNDGPWGETAEQVRAALAQVLGRIESPVEMLER